jgi:ribosomal protein L35
MVFALLARSMWGHSMWRGIGGMGLELVRTLKTKSSAKKRFRINGKGLLQFKRSGKHHKMVKRTVASSSRLGLTGTFSQSVSTRLRKAYFPGW